MRTTVLAKGASLSLQVPVSVPAAGRSRIAMREYFPAPALPRARSRGGGKGRLVSSTMLGDAVEGRSVGW